MDMQTARKIVHDYYISLSESLGQCDVHDLWDTPNSKMDLLNPGTEPILVKDIDLQSLIPGTNWAIVEVDRFGGEGQGDHAEITWGVFEILDRNSNEFQLHPVAVLFCQISGYYSSEWGTDWDAPSDLSFVQLKKNISVAWV
jgi:hypothetical protein